MGRRSFTVRDDPPGQEPQVDFSYQGLWRDATSGKRRKLWALCMMLSHSRHMPLVGGLCGDQAGSAGLDSGPRQCLCFLWRLSGSRGQRQPETRRAAPRSLRRFIHREDVLGTTVTPIRGYNAPDLGRTVRSRASISPTRACSRSQYSGSRCALSSSTVLPCCSTQV